MKRTGSIGSAVPPAVTTMRRPSRSASRTAASARAGARRPIGGPDRPAGRRPPRRRRRSSAVSASRPSPVWPDASGPSSGSTIGVAEAPGAGDVGLRRRVAVHLAVHGRRDDDRRGGGEAGGRHDVTGQAVGHGRQPVGRGRRDDDRVGRIRGDDVADALVGQQLEEVLPHRVAAQRGERERRHERRRRPATGRPAPRRPRPGGAAAARPPCRRRSSP